MQTLGFRNGLQRTLMELMRNDSQSSKRLVDDLTLKDLSVQDTYRIIQDLAYPRMIIDKSPSYSQNMGVLLKAEEMFEAPKYIYLIRHPYSVIESFVRNRFDKLMNAGDVDPHDFAEYIWTRDNQNVLDFFDQLDPLRYHLVRYEEMVADPARVMSNLCEFLGLQYDDAVLEPYQGGRMIDGTGDPNIHEHDGIESKLGEIWREIRLPRPLSQAGRDLAYRLNYELPLEPVAQN
jgi:hypothetical protein